MSAKKRVGSSPQSIPFYVMGGFVLSLRLMPPMAFSAHIKAISGANPESKQSALSDESAK